MAATATAATVAAAATATKGVMMREEREKRIEIKEKGAKIVIKIEEYPYRHDITKIKIKKGKILEELEEEEDYWELMIGRARKIRGVEDVKRYIRRIEEIVKIEIYDKDLMRETKREMEKREEWRDGENIVNIRKMREEDDTISSRCFLNISYGLNEVNDTKSSLLHAILICCINSHT